MFECPACRRVSHNPNDARERYCGYCHVSFPENWHLLPAGPGVCPECAVAHEPDQPHNQQSLFYQYHFYFQHKRWPTWADAVQHCPKVTQLLWVAELRKRGVNI